MLRYAIIGLAGVIGFTGRHTSPPAAALAPLALASRHAAADTLDPAAYEGWKQYMLICSRCHGEEAQGSSFGPSLLQALKPDGPVPGKEAFVAILSSGIPDKGMPSAKTLGLDPAYIDGMYQYLKGRSDGTIHPGRPVKRGS